MAPAPRACTSGARRFMWASHRRPDGDRGTGTVARCWCMWDANSCSAPRCPRTRCCRSNPAATAPDVLADRAGVCRDFAHLGVALCRALSIPARYAFGYLPDIGVPVADTPMDFCAWMEVFVGGRWWTFDPRKGTGRIGRVLIG